MAFYTVPERMGKGFINTKKDIFCWSFLFKMPFGKQEEVVTHVSQAQGKVDLYFVM